MIRSHKACGAWNARNKRSLQRIPANCTLDPPPEREREGGRGREKRSIRYGESISSTTRGTWLVSIVDITKDEGNGFSDPLRLEMSWVKVCAEVARSRGSFLLDLGWILLRGRGEEGTKGFGNVRFISWPEFRSPMIDSGDRFVDFACGAASIWISLEDGSWRWRCIKLRDRYWISINGFEILYVLPFFDWFISSYSGASSSGYEFRKRKEGEEAALKKNRGNERRYECHSWLPVHVFTVHFRVGWRIATFYREMCVCKKRDVKAGWINKMRDKGRNEKRLYLFFINMRLRRCRENVMKNK